MIQLPLKSKCLQQMLFAASQGRQYWMNALAENLVNLNRFFNANALAKWKIRHATRKFWTQNLPSSLAKWKIRHTTRKLWTHNLPSSFSEPAITHTLKFRHPKNPEYVRTHSSNSEEIATPIILSLNLWKCDSIKAGTSPLAYLPGKPIPQGFTHVISPQHAHPQIRPNFLRSNTEPRNRWKSKAFCNNCCNIPR